MGDKDQPRVPAGSPQGGEWTSASKVASAGSNIVLQKGDWKSSLEKIPLSGADSLSLSENKALTSSLAEVYKNSPTLRDAETVVTSYVESQSKALATREIVGQALLGKSAEEIYKDSKVKKLIQKHNEVSSEAITSKDCEKLVAASAGYYETLRQLPSSKDVIYRGVSTAPKGEEFELRGPTAFSHSMDVALTYGKTLIQVDPGAKMIPSHALSAIKERANGDVHATLPVFYNRKESTVHPKGPAHGFSIGFDTDREFTSSGRFKVKRVETRNVNYTDVLTGKRKSKLVSVVVVDQIGVF